jgi:hypothetical protein
MLKNLVPAIKSAILKLFQHWQITGINLLLFLILLSSFYLFISIGQARIWQVLITLLLTLFIPLLFFLFQTMVVGYVQPERKLFPHLKNAGQKFWKLFVISIPIILLAWLTIYLINRYQVDLSKPIREVARTPQRAQVSPPPRPREWREIILNTIWYLSLYLVFPLSLIQLWIAANFKGLGRAFKSFPQIFLRTFLPAPLVVYLVGSIFFLFTPLFLIFSTTPIGTWWMDLTVLALRLIVAAIFIFFGWTLTVGILAELNLRADNGSLEAVETVNEPLPNDTSQVPA